MSNPVRTGITVLEKGATAVVAQQRDVAEIVRGVIDDIRANGDEAVRRYSAKFDNWSPDSFELAPDRIRAVVHSVPTAVLDDIRTVQANVRDFARR
ncbi:Histidinol dehydrogenase [Nocardia amikacinitolerans]|nr:Histidinol dehydrogenase [Nocardia amikacinitolerans]